MTDGETASTIQPFNASTIPARHRVFSLSRILAITSNTLTELTRLKVFYVLLVFGLLLIGHLEATAREYWLTAHGGGLVTRVFLAIVALLFPDLQAFNLVDDIVAGTAISMAVFTKTALLGIFYTVIYTLLAVFVFYGKEL